MACFFCFIVRFVGSENFKNCYFCVAFQFIIGWYDCFILLFVFQTDKKRAVDKADGKLWADAHGFLYFEVSALTGDGIPDLFQVN